MVPHEQGLAYTTYYLDQMHEIKSIVPIVLGYFIVVDYSHRLCLLKFASCGSDDKKVQLRCFLKSQKYDSFFLRQMNKITYELQIFITNPDGHKSIIVYHFNCEEKVGVTAFTIN